LQLSLHPFPILLFVCPIFIPLPFPPSLPHL
jgi:hypothetical protein